MRASGCRHRRAAGLGNRRRYRRTRIGKTERYLPGPRSSDARDLIGGAWSADELNQVEPGPPLLKAQAGDFHVLKAREAAQSRIVARRRGTSEPLVSSSR
jgi:hypothetical protein